MCMLIISYRWEKKRVCMRLLRYMRDTFLELQTLPNDELVQGNINESISIQIIKVSIKYTLCAMWIKFLRLLRRNGGPCTEMKIWKWVTSDLRPLQSS